MTDDPKRLPGVIWVANFELGKNFARAWDMRQWLILTPNSWEKKVKGKTYLPHILTVDALPMTREEFRGIAAGFEHYQPYWKQYGYGGCQCGCVDCQVLRHCTEADCIGAEAAAKVARMPRDGDVR